MSDTWSGGDVSDCLISISNRSTNSLISDVMFSGEMSVLDTFTEDWDQTNWVPAKMQNIIKISTIMENNHEVIGEVIFKD